MTQVSKAYQSDPGLLNLLQQLQIPYPTTAIHIGRKVGSLPALINEHNECVRSLEGVLGRYLAAGGEAKGVKRPTIRVGGTMGCGGRKVVSDFWSFESNKGKETDLSIMDTGCY